MNERERENAQRKLIERILEIEGISKISFIEYIFINIKNVFHQFEIIKERFSKI